jgi:hypothetical protein
MTTIISPCRPLAGGNCFPLLHESARQASKAIDRQDIFFVFITNELIFDK